MNVLHASSAPSSSLLTACLGFLSQTGTDGGILYAVNQTHVAPRSCIHTHSRRKKKKFPKDREIKTPSSRFHLTLFRIFPSRCLPLGPSCRASCRASLIWLGHCLPRYRRPGELSPALCILPSVGFHSSGQPLSRRDVSLQRARSLSLCPLTGPCCKPEGDGDEAIRPMSDIAHAMVVGSPTGGPMVAFTLHVRAQIEIVKGKGNVKLD